MQLFISVTEALALRGKIRSWSGCLSGTDWEGVAHTCGGVDAPRHLVHVQNSSPTGYERRGESSRDVEESRWRPEVGQTLTTIWKTAGRRATSYERVVVPDGWAPRRGKSVRRQLRRIQRELERAVALRRGAELAGELIEDHGLEFARLRAKAGREEHAAFGGVRRLRIIWHEAARILGA